MRQMSNAGSCLFETPGEQQRSGNQTHQLRAPQRQFFALLLMQTQQQHDHLLFEQVLETEVLQQADRHFVFLGEQGLFEGRFPVLFSTEPLACTPMPRASRRPLLIAQQLRERGENLQPVAGVPPRFDKTAQRLQGPQVLSALPGPEQVIAQSGIEAGQVGQHAPDLAQLRRQRAEQLMLQVIEQGGRPPQGTLS